MANCLFLAFIVVYQEYGSVPNTLLFPFISLYWGSLMMGRWTGAAEAMTEDQKL